jgi:hypothetical protein
MEDKAFILGAEHNFPRADVENLRSPHGNDIARPNGGQHAPAKNAQGKRSRNAQNLGRKGAANLLFDDCEGLTALGNRSGIHG